MFVYMTPSLCGIRGPGRIGRCCYGHVMLEPTAARIQLETDRQKRLCLRIFASVNISSRRETIGALFQLEGEISMSMDHRSRLSSLMTLD